VPALAVAVADLVVAELGVVAVAAVVVVVEAVTLDGRRARGGAVVVVVPVVREAAVPSSPRWWSRWPACARWSWWSCASVGADLVVAELGVLAVGAVVVVVAVRRGGPGGRRTRGARGVWVADLVVAEIIMLTVLAAGRGAGVLAVVVVALEAALPCSPRWCRARVLALPTGPSPQFNNSTGAKST
jgi:hypothetical protein